MGIAGSQPEGVRTGRVMLWRSVAVVFTVEFVVMLVLRALGLPFDVTTALADSVLLSVVALPLLYAVILRPATALAARQAGALAEARFETVAGAIQDAVLIFDLERTIRFANRAAERTFGCAQGALLGAEMERLMPGDTAAGFREDMARYAPGGDTPVIGRGRVEREAQRASGERFPAEITVSPTRSAEGLRFVVVLRDLTEQRRAEEALRESERRLRTLLEALPVAVRIVQDDRVVFANPADAALFGYGNPAEQEGADAFGQIAEEDADRVRDFVRSQLSAESAPRWCEGHARRPDGSLVPVEITGERIVHAGAPAALLVLRDLSERRRLRMFERLLPVCAVCGRIRDDAGAEGGAGSWGRLDQYVSRHSNARVSHTYCPECAREFLRQAGLPASPDRAGGSMRLDPLGGAPV